jgi:hypothetical protein
LRVSHISRPCGIEQRNLVDQADDVAISRLCGIEIHDPVDAISILSAASAAMHAN